jgi:hypothetical protein
MDRWLLIVVVKFDDEIPEVSDWLKFFGQLSFSKGYFLRAWDLTLFEKWRPFSKNGGKFKKSKLINKKLNFPNEKNR